MNITVVCIQSVRERLDVIDVLGGSKMIRCFRQSDDGETDLRTSLRLAESHHDHWKTSEYDENEWASVRLWASAFGPLAAQLKEQDQLWYLNDMWVWTSAKCRVSWG